MFSFQKCYLKMDKRSKGKKILFVCERNSAQSPFVSKTYITSQRNFIHSTIQDGGALQPLPGKAKEHDGTKLDMLINVICLAAGSMSVFILNGFSPPATAPGCWDILLSLIILPGFLHGHPSYFTG